MSQHQTIRLRDATSTPGVQWSWRFARRKSQALLRFPLHTGWPAIGASQYAEHLLRAYYLHPLFTAFGKTANPAGEGKTGRVVAELQPRFCVQGGPWRGSTVRLSANSIFGNRDEITSLEAFLSLFRQLRGDNRNQAVQGADHLLFGHEPKVARAVAAYFGEVFGVE